MRLLFPRLVLYTFSGIFCSVLLSSCAKENAFDCVKSTGAIRTEIRTLPAFHTLKILDNANVWLVPDTIYFAEVKAGENLLKNLKTEVENDELVVQNINKCNWVRSYKKPMEVWVHTPEIKTIVHDGFGTIASSGELKTGELILHVTGAGDLDLEVKTEKLWVDMYELGNVKLRGSNNSLNAFVMSSGKLETKGLLNREAILQMGGDGSATVFASRSVSATINGRGNVFYAGDPAQVYRTGQGTGQLLKTE